MKVKRVLIVTSDNDITAPVVGDVLTVGVGTSDPDGDGTFSYQWQRNGDYITGATSPSYEITEADDGNSLTVVVSYTDGGGTDEVVTIPVFVNNIATAIVAEYFTSEGEGTDGFFVFKTEGLIPVNVSFLQRSINSATTVREFNTASESEVYIRVGGDGNVQHGSVEILEAVNAAINEGRITSLTSAEIDPNREGTDEFIIQGFHEITVNSATRNKFIAEDADTSSRIKIADLVLTDEDGGNAGTLVRAGRDADEFEIVGTEVFLKQDADLDHETAEMLEVRVQLSEDTSIFADLAVTINDVNDEDPVITSSATGDALTEGTVVPNTQVIYTATGVFDVTDISWSLSGPNAGLFDIDDVTGDVTFKRETTPDLEGKGSYIFTVVATSGALPAVEQAVTIGVTEPSAQLSQAPAQQQPQQGVEFSFDATYEDLGDDIPPQSPDMI